MDHAKLDAAADSSISKMAARWFTPILLATLGWLIIDKLNAQDDQLDKVVAKQEQQSDRLAEQAVTLAEVKGDVKRLDAKVDATVLYQLEDLRKRVERIEAATPVP